MVYRITDRLYVTCSTMLTMASHMTTPPYCAVTAGPISHSPPPIAEPAIIRPGPTSAPNLQRSEGAGGNSPTSQGDMHPAGIVSGLPSLWRVSDMRYSQSVCNRVGCHIIPKKLAFLLNRTERLVQGARGKRSGGNSQYNPPTEAGHRSALT